MIRLLATVLILFSLPLFAQTIYLKPEEALSILFHDSKEVVSETKTLSGAQKNEVEKNLGSRLEKDSWNFYIARSGRKIDGYALIDHEVGKTEPITFITAITPDGKVQEVEILVYREPYGSEVHEKMFLRQYQGKNAASPIRVGQDIGNISGATLSARAVSIGVKRALRLWKVFYEK